MRVRPTLIRNVLSFLPVMTCANLIVRLKCTLHSVYDTVNSRRHIIDELASGQFYAQLVLLILVVFRFFTFLVLCAANKDCIKTLLLLATASTRLTKYWTDLYWDKKQQRWLHCRISFFCRIILLAFKWECEQSCICYNCNKKEYTNLH